MRARHYAASDSGAANRVTPGVPVMGARILKAGLWTISLTSIAAFLYLCYRRIGYPLELHAIEGVMMDHVVRLAQGRALYVEPSLEFIPLAQMPGFAALASILARLFGPALWEPRLVSLVSMLVVAVLVGRIVVAETGDRILGVAGVGILLAAHGVTGGRYDVGHPDSLMLALALGGLAALRFTTGFLGALAAALLLTLAFFTQAHAAWFVLAALVHLAINDRRRWIAFGIAVALGCGGGYALLAWWLGPWFTFYTWDVPIHAWRFHPTGILGYVGRGLVGTLGALAIPTLLSLSLARPAWRGAAGVWIWAGWAALGLGVMTSLDPDEFRNVMTPTVVALAVLGPISLVRLLHHIAAWPGSERLGRSAAVHLVLGLQFLPLAYNVRAQLPRPMAREARAEMVRMLREYPGPVLVLEHGHYGWSAGKGTSLQPLALDHLLRARGNRLLAREPRFFERMFDRLRRGEDRPMIITGAALERTGLESRPLWSSLAASYELRGEMGWVGETLEPINGPHSAPRRVYVPRADVPGLTDSAGLSANVAVPRSGAAPAPP